MGPTVGIVSAPGGTTIEEGREDRLHTVLRQGTPDPDIPHISTRKGEHGGRPLWAVLRSCCVSTEYQGIFPTTTCPGESCPEWQSPCQATVSISSSHLLWGQLLSPQSSASCAQQYSRTFPVPKLTLANSCHPCTDKQEVLWPVLGSVWSLIY